MSVISPFEKPTPWSELEGPAIARQIRDAIAKKDLDTAIALMASDLRARFRTEDKLPDWYKPE